MASTRNKNTKGDYNLEINKYKNSETYNLYKNSQYGVAYDTKLPGNGLLPGQISWGQFATNYSDTESYLLGINSTNLVNPALDFKPELINLDCANIYEKTKIYIPEPLIIERGQRPFPIPD
jgi:hypothetical protein